MIRKCGVDIGGVIIGGKTDETDILIHGDTKQEDMFFTDRYMETPPVDGAFEGVQHLVERTGPENTYIVSKCGFGTWLRSLEWLRQPFEQYDGLNFFEFTGVIDTEGVYLHRCKKRPQKALIARSLGLTDFFDDRTDVLRPMKDIVDNRYLVGPQTGTVPEGVILLPKWNLVTIHI